MFQLFLFTEISLLEFFTVILPLLSLQFYTLDTEQWTGQTDILVIYILCVTHYFLQKELF